MKSLNYMDSYNAIVGAIITVLSMVFGENWKLFTLFLLLNTVDWITGWMKSRFKKEESSTKGWQGVLKKLGYWLMILVAFVASYVFIDIGKVLGIDLGITTLLGWFVLASLIINEMRSIVENLVEAGYKVPKILTKGLEVANRVINQEDEE